MYNYLFKCVPLKHENKQFLNFPYWVLLSFVTGGLKTIFVNNKILFSL